MLITKASEENQNASGTSVDFELTREETQELHDYDFVVVNNEKYCITKDENGDVMVWIPFTEWSGLKQNYGGRK